MNIIGDLERFVATSVYPYRLPLAILGIAFATLLILVASRRGWFAAARRRPGRTLAALAVVLVIGAPLAWYLGSPLFIRTELVEPPVAAGVVPSPSPSAGIAGVVPSPMTDGSPVAAEPMRLTGAFTGADDFHFGSGTAELVETAPGSYSLRFEDFSVRNGPDLFVYLSADPAGSVDGAIELGPLKATEGAFNTAVPAGTEIGDVRSVVIWCKQFAVLFAVAPLEG